MKRYHTAGSNEGLRLPHSGFLAGKLADVLRLKGHFDDGFSASYKTVQRYFSGERVEPNIVSEVLDTLVDGLVPNTLTASIDGTDYSVNTFVRDGLEYYLRRWDSLVAEVNSRLYPVHEEKDLPVPILRLVCLDAGLRYGSWLARRSLLTGSEELQVPGWLHNRVLAWIIHRAGICERVALFKLLRSLRNVTSA